MAKRGRKPFGVTKKVSITLSKEEWDELSQEENLSGFLRQLVRSHLEQGDTQPGGKKVPKMILDALGIHGPRGHKKNDRR